MESIGVVVLHDDDGVVRAVGESVESSAGLFVAGTSPGATGQVVVAGGRYLDEAPGGAPVVALADGDALGAARAALAIAARDIIRWPDEAERLSGAIRRAAGGADTRREPGTVIAVAGARGGVGTSTVAALLGARLRESVILDLDGGGQRGLSAEDPARTTDDLTDVDPERLAGALVPHAGGSRALHAGAAPVGDRARALTTAARRVAPVVVADLGRALDPGADRVIEAATRRVLVAGDDVGSVRGGTSLIERCGGAWVLVVRRLRRAGVPVRALASALDLEPVTVIPHDPRLARAADLARMPTRGRAARAADRLVQALALDDG